MTDLRFAFRQIRKSPGLCTFAQHNVSSANCHPIDAHPPANALLLGRLLTTQRYQVSPHNPALLAIASILPASVALIACLIPARRAARVDPMIALRAE